MSNHSPNLQNRLIFQAEDGVFSGVTVATSIQGYTGNGYVTNLMNNGDFIKVSALISEEGYYELMIRQASLGGDKRNLLYVDNECFGEFISEASDEFVESKLCTVYLKPGTHFIKVVKSWGEIEIDCFILAPVNEPKRIDPTFQLVNPHANSECMELMNFFKDIYGRKIITGQHTAAANGPEIDYIQNATGKTPALRGFDLLSYSLNTDTQEPTDHKILEINENKGTIEQAIDWYKEHNGIVTFCWHWYSPIGGRDKSFYTKNTDFDLTKALVQGTDEYNALLADMDEIAHQLKRLQDQNVPILWRPLHEADGGWFWWGAKGAESYKKLYRWMFEHFTNHHQLHHLIWVWNAPNPDWYPGSDYVDIAGMDTYMPNGTYGPLKCQFDQVYSIIKGEKPIALTENGPIPDPDLLIDSQTPWLWYMPWYGDFVMGGESTTNEQLKKVYDHSYSITLADLN